MLRSLLHRQHTSSSTASFSSWDSSMSQSPISPREHDTGFAASFCGNCNTSRPHPDADLSPNASISQDDVPLSKVQSRHRRSFLGRHKRTISHGMINEDMRHADEARRTQMQGSGNDRIVESLAESRPAITLSGPDDEPSEGLFGDGASSMGLASPLSSTGTSPDDDIEHAREPALLHKTIERNSTRRRSLMGRFYSHRKD